MDPGSALCAVRGDNLVGLRAYPVSSQRTRTYPNSRVVSSQEGEAIKAIGDLLLFFLGGGLGLLLFGVVALPVVYGVPKAFVCAARGRCSWLTPFKYLLFPIFWSVAFAVAFALLAQFWYPAFSTLKDSAKFNIGSMIGFWGSGLRTLLSRSARNDLREDFEDFVSRKSARRG
jgi:hypothetical protein